MKFFMGKKNNLVKKYLGPDTLQTPSRHPPDTLQTCWVGGWVKVGINTNSVELSLVETELGNTNTMETALGSATEQYEVLS